MSNTINELVKRQSVRIFTDKKISLKDRNNIIKATINAPTAGNMQMYSIIDVKDKKVIKKLSVLCDNQKFINDAKMVLVFCADYQKWFDAFTSLKLDVRKPDLGDLLLSIEDTMIAAQNSVTAAYSLGISSCYIGDIMENYEKVVKLLSLSRYVYPACMVVYGYADKKHVQSKKPKRFNNKYVVFSNKYKRLSKSELKDMFADRTKIKGYKEWMMAFLNRKINSDFSKEMSRSANLYIDRYKNKI